MACPNRPFAASPRAGICPRTGYACPRLAGRIVCTTGGNATAAAAAEAVARGESPPYPGTPDPRYPGCANPVGYQLYGGETGAPEIRTTCVDPCGGARSYPIGARNPYWPTFAHPRWLGCNQLYSRAPHL